jgi:hypothetical protein
MSAAKPAPKAADDDLGGKAILESALIAIEGVAAVLLVIGAVCADDIDASAVARAADYLADRLREHREEAMDGLRRAFPLDQYQRGDRVRP